MSFNGLEGCRDEPCPRRLPSQSRPSPPSLLAPRGREAGVGERVASPVQFNPVPSTVPFNESVRTGTFVRRKSLPGIDYGRTTSIGPEETGPGTESDSRLCVPTIRVPSRSGCCTRPWTHLTSVPINPVPRSESRPTCGPFPPKVSGPVSPCPVPIRWWIRPWTLDPGRWTRRPHAGASPVPSSSVQRESN
jgi:hypothetical protein